MQIRIGVGLQSRVVLSLNSIWADSSLEKWLAPDAAYPAVTFDAKVRQVGFHRPFKSIAFCLEHGAAFGTHDSDFLYKSVTFDL